MRPWKDLAAGSMLLAALALPARAGPVEDAGAAYRRGDYAAAAGIYRSLAGQGNADAQSALGNMYLKGLGVSKDERQAVKWFRRAAALGQAGAQFNLGQLYLKGVGVDPDLQAAARWYSRAAEQGHVQAQFVLAVLYKIGAGVPANAQRAAFWYERAALQGHAEAQSQLGMVYAEGRGRPRDAVAAYKWLTLANIRARSNGVRTQAVQALQRLAARMTQAQIAEAQRLAREWRPMLSSTMR